MGNPVTPDTDLHDYTDVVGDRIYRDDFLRLVVAHPSIVFSLIKSLSRRLRETSDQLLETRR